MDYTEIPALIPESVRGIIFDYGGTLDSHGDHWSHIILDAYRKAGVEIGVEEFKTAYIYGERELAKEGKVKPEDTFLDLMRKKIDAESSQLNPRPAAETCEKIALYCYEEARRCTAQAKTMLDGLGERYPLAVVSNFYGNLNAVLEDFGLRSCFKAVVESATCGIRKPDPEIFRLGTEALGLRAEEVMVIGDKPEQRYRTGKDHRLHDSAYQWTAMASGAVSAYFKNFGARMNAPKEMPKFQLPSCDGV